MTKVTNDRPFFKSSIVEIEDEFAKRKIGDSIKDIIHELSFRNTRRAKKLFAKIKNDKFKSKDHLINKENSYSKNVKTINEKDYTNFDIQDDENDIILDNNEDD